MKHLLNYALGESNAANPDGTNPVKITQCSVIPGPEMTLLGKFTKALDFAPNGQASIETHPVPEVAKFCFRLVIKPAATTTRQSVLHCSKLPLSISVNQGLDNTQVKLIARIQNANSGWTSVVAALPLNAWSVVDVAYDLDTLALFVNEQLLAIAAFPLAKLATTTENQLSLGCAMGMFGKEQFLGQLAALQLIDGIPENLENDLDARRGTPEWQISLKANTLRPGLDLGQPDGPLLQDAKKGYFTQAFQKGIIFFDPADGQSAEMHGPIYDFWKSQPALQPQLGNLMRDEMGAKKAGTRKSIFENGGIFWSAATGAVPIVGQHVLAGYIKIGEAAYPAGLPKTAVTTVSGGLRQELQNGLMYFHSKTKTSFFLHGALATKYMASGGHNKWGLPVTDVKAVKKSTGTILGYTAQLEKNAVIFSKPTGSDAFILTGKFLETYLLSGGPKGSLGFPASDVTSISATIKHAAFEHGAIVQIGTKEPVVINSFTIMISRVETDESEGIGDVNELYMHFYLRQSGNEVYHKRYPESGEVEKNIVSLNYKTQAFNPADPQLSLSLELDVWESDWGNDDHLGNFKKDLNINNLWGLSEKPDGIFKSGKVSQINNIDWAVQPEVTENTPFDFWETGNPTTATISELQYAATFRDVDPNPDWYSPADWLRKLYYELAVKKAADNGNCSGMCIEAIYAWKENSLYGRPLRRFASFDAIKNEINIKQCYQLGAEGIGWFVGQFLSGNTSNPKDVFTDTQAFFKAGMNPVLCVAKDWKLTDGHCLLPFAWEKTASVWKISVFDPNKKNVVQTVNIDPVKNTFDYLQGKYTGGTDIAGGQLHYQPWAIYNHQPVTPVSGLLDLGMTLILSAAVGTLGLSDQQGNNLVSNQSAEEVAKELQGKFISVPRLDGATGRLNGELLLRPPSSDNKAPADFNHLLNGAATGDLKYGVKWKRQAFQLQSSIARNEQNTISMRNMGSLQQMATLQSPKDKLLHLTTEQKLGDGKDFVRLEISQIPVKAGLAAQLNIQPGGGAIDILSGPEPVNAQVMISGAISGQVFKQEYEARLAGGTRLVFSHARSANLIKMGKIDRVFGNMNSPVLIAKK